jgi:hypothetical protein
MRRARMILVTAAGIAGLVVACRGSGAPAPQTAASAPAATPQVSPVQRFNDSVSRAVLARIGARQSDSAGKVFVNMQLENLKGVSAGTLIVIMNIGYAKALGVTCEHCHDMTDFSSDAKRPKRAAREMALLHRMINQQLAKMEHIATPPTQNRAINCATCHRGMIIPVK